MPVTTRAKTRRYSLRGVVHSDSNILGGELVFVGTRVPVSILFEYLMAGDTLESFLRQFPTVSREQARTVIRRIGHAAGGGRTHARVAG